MKPFKVHLRSKAIGNDQLSLYLDFGRNVFHPTKNKSTRRDYLGLYIYANPKTKAERKHNRDINEIAERRQAETLIAIQKGTYGALDTEGQKTTKRGQIDFYEFFAQRMNTRKGKTRLGYKSALYHLKNFAGDKLLVKDITVEFLLSYRDYLGRAKAAWRERLLSSNSKVLYFTLLKTVLREGFARKILSENFADTLKSFAPEQPSRPFFLDDEVKRLRDTEFPKCPILRRAALFAILTSLRFSDIKSLRYESIQFDKEMGYFIDFTIKKINCPDILYLTEKALEVCEYEDYKKGKIFPLMNWEVNLLPEWYELAGVKNPPGIKFHIFRHTFGMRALNKGEPLEDVSAMMGHKSPKTTQIYAKLLAKNKRAAIHRVTLD